MSQTAQLKTIAEISSVASDAIFKFQTRKINRDQLYRIGIELTCQYNHLVNSQQVDLVDAKTASGFLYAIKHFSTC